jgi:hypothetical protein
MLLHLIVFLAAACAHCSAVRLDGVGYNTARPPMDSPAYPYKDRVEDTVSIAPPGIREARLICDSKGHVDRIITCEIHTFDICGNPDGESGNTTQWITHVESIASQRSSALIAPILWLRRGVARFYWTPVSIGVHVVTVSQASSLAFAPLTTKAPMAFPVTVHESRIDCTGFLLNGPPRPTQQLLWAQGARSNSRRAIYGMEPQTSDRTFIFADSLRAWGAGRGSGLGTPTGRNPVQPFAAPDLGDMPRVDNSAFRFCEYLQNSA